MQHGDQARLVFASFLMLFVELALIRWITANNVYVTEATNFVLLASFLGIGIGFLNAASGRDYLRWTPVALLALVAFVLEFPVVLHSGTGGPLIFSGVGQSRALPQPLSFASCFPAHRRGHGGARPGRREALHPLPAAERVPAGHSGQHRRDSALLRPVFPRPAAG